MVTETDRATAREDAVAAREADRRRQLATMKRRATAVLVLMAAVFVALTVLTDDHGWAGYARAAAEASMIGGLADWFAVTAIFRHPLGLPIPHTAVIPERKDQFGATLGEFVQQNFLSPDVISERVRESRLGTRAAAWLADPANADAVARYGAELVVSLADVVRDEDVHRLMEEEAGRLVDSLPLAPIAGKALRLMTEQQRHEELFDAVLRGLERFLDENAPAFRQRFGRESPWWVPEAVEDRIFERLLDGVRRLLQDANDPDHEVRKRFEERVAELTVQLETSPAMRERGDRLKHDLLEHPALRQWSTSLWTEVKATLRSQAADPESELRRRLAAAVAAGGERLLADPALVARAERAAEVAVARIADQFHGEIAGLVSGTVARWDGEETANKLELLLGRDLQFIRINGTVVGGIAGLAIHAVAQLLS